MASVADVQTQFTADKIQAKKDAAKLASADGTNPGSQLDKDAFLKLLLTELQYQDPTSPMDTEKMLTQTSQLATLEMQENTNSTMKELVSQLQANSSMYALSALGKMANIGTDRVSVTEETVNLTIPIYFPSNATGGTLSITDSNGNVVRTESIGSQNAGTNTFNWNLITNSGTKAGTGTYAVKVNYTDSEGNAKTATYGSYPVEAVKFIDGKAQVKIAGEYISADDVSEYYEEVNLNNRQTNTSSSSTNNQTPKQSVTESALATENALADEAEAEYNALLNRG
ncbi:flagellar basal body rod modification protein [Campylobacter californiensis]|uniref:flagellar basal body rod modification protein n=1 Tax=Campylobacter californiensis TaxID=1032243 RepID=UPI001475816F|nr:flagellar basal body rod modification protein [Campylobacter sp. RM12916]MBE3610474.1 flagellar basal body rod modification protein [Campylobacter sp. RM12916]